LAKRCHFSQFVSTKLSQKSGYCENVRDQLALHANAADFEYKSWEFHFSKSSGNKNNCSSARHPAIATLHNQNKPETFIIYANVIPASSNGLSQKRVGQSGAQQPKA